MLNKVTNPFSRNAKNYYITFFSNLVVHLTMKELTQTFVDEKVRSKT